MNAVKRFNNGADFRKSLEIRLLKHAGNIGVSLQRLRKQVSFERFLARLFESQNTPWILKGGHAMELRIKLARATQDIDLFVKSNKILSDQHIVLEHLQEDCSKDLSDFFEYRVSPSNISLVGPPYGGFRFPVEARVASRTFEKFHLDVGIGDVCYEPLEKIKGKDWLDFCGISAPLYSVISIEQQFAEKIHAYTLPREHRYNTRVKDLVDLSLLIKLNQANNDRMLTALKLTFFRRNTHTIPLELKSPPEEWKKTFPALAQECNLLGDMESNFRTIDEFYQNIILSLREEALQN